MPCTRNIDEKYSVTIRSNPLPRDAGWESSGDIFNTETCEDIDLQVWAEGATLPIAEERAFRLAGERLRRRRR